MQTSTAAEPTAYRRAQAVRKPAAPKHPGQILREEVLEARGMTQRELAEHLRLNRVTLNLIVTGKNGVSAETALRLERLLGARSAAEWLQLQNAYDLHMARTNEASRNRINAVVPIGAEADAMK